MTTEKKPLDEPPIEWRVLWTAIGRWLQPRALRLLVAIATVAFFILGMLALIAAPLGAFVALINNHALSRVDKDILYLTPCGRGFLLLVVAATFIGSLAVGAYGRSLLKPRFVQLPWLALVGLALLWGLINTQDEIRQVASQIAGIKGGDNAKAAAFVAFWAVMVSYAAKAVWDELRDRLSNWIDGKLPKSDASVTKTPA